MSNKMTAQDKQWQAESDARMLMEMMEVQQDKQRFAAAQKQLKKQRDAMDMALEKAQGGR